MFRPNPDPTKIPSRAAVHLVSYPTNLKCIFFIIHDQELSNSLKSNGDLASSLKSLDDFAKSQSDFVNLQSDSSMKAAEEEASITPAFESGTW